MQIVSLLSCKAEDTSSPQGMLTQHYTTPNIITTMQYPSTPRTPDFNNLLAVLKGEQPDRPTFFDFIVSPGAMLGEERVQNDDPAEMAQILRSYFNNAYDFACLPCWLTKFLWFPKGDRHALESISQNESGLIQDEESFEKYPWPDPSTADYTLINDLGKELPCGAKFIVMAPSGILENLVELVGFEDLCYMLADEPELVGKITEALGTRILHYYERQLEYDEVGAVVMNDDWGYKTQTMISPDQLREYVFPWHKKIVELAHSAGRPAILHSCGNLKPVWDDIIDDIGYDAKHSYEDIILPIEEAYETYGSRIALLGGLDIDFLCRSTPDEIYRRSKALLEQTAQRGGYALGTGNSVTDYIPRESFLAMQKAVLE